MNKFIKVNLEHYKGVKQFNNHKVYTVLRDTDCDSDSIVLLFLNPIVLIS